MFVRRFEAAVLPEARPPAVAGVGVPGRRRGALRVGPADDRHERAADHVARRVAGGTAYPRAIGSREPGGHLRAGTEQAIRQARGHGRALPPSVRGPMERELGADLAGVRLHTDVRADRLSRSLQALAFTTGDDIFFRRGGYAPDSAAGRHVLAHELTHVAQQRSAAGTAGGATVQRLVASVNHGLRDPKGEPKDDYGTYRSLDVALHSGAGAVYKGPNEARKGGVLDQLAKGNPDNVKLRRDEDLYLVGHGSKDKIGMMGPATTATAIARITPDDWRGAIYSLNCWSGYRRDDQPSALEKLDQALIKMGRDVAISGPTGRSIRHLDWLGEKDSPMGMRAVVSQLESDEDTIYNDILDRAQKEAGIKTTPEDAFDAALRVEYTKREVKGVADKAAFATEWGRDFQAGLVQKLKSDGRLEKAVLGKRLMFGRTGLLEKQAPQDLLNLPLPLPETSVQVTAPEDLLKLPELSVVSPQEQQQIVHHGHAVDVGVGHKPPEEVHPPRTGGGAGGEWTWLSITGVGLVGVAALGTGYVVWRLLSRR